MKSLYLFILLGLVVLSCSGPNKVSKPTVTVTVVPQKFFINQIAGNWLAVNVMVPPGSNPATYEPTPLQMRDLSNSQLYFSIGHLGFEKAWLGKFASINSDLKIVDTSNDMDLIEEESFEVSHEENHDHDHHHSHVHEGYNPHTWLSPQLVKQQAEIICNELSLKFPEQAASMQNNLKAFVAKVDSTSNVLKTQLASNTGAPFIVYHPVWTYLAHEYQLQQVSIEFNGKEASPRKLKEIIDFAKANDIHTIFVQKEFSTSQAQSIANEINGDVVQLNPLAYNWFEVMHEFGNAFSGKK